MGVDFRGGFGFHGNGHGDVLRAEGAVRVVLLVARVLGNAVGSAGLDCVVVVRIGQAVPRQQDRQLQPWKMHQAAVVVLGCCPHVNVEITCKKQI